MTKSVPTNFEKHRSSNPIQQWLIGRFNAQLVQCLRTCGNVKSILDVGCGEGFSLAMIQDSGSRAVLSGIDYSDDALALGRKQFPDLDLKKGDIYALAAADTSVDVVLCTEVLEHLNKPDRALAELVRVSRGYVLVSVPNEPWFRLANLLRGKYVKRWGNHPEHINLWSRDAFIQLLRSAGLEIVSIHNPFPWTMVLAQVPAI